MTTINPKKWFYCGLCKSTAYTFECCGNCSCSGGGCDECGGDSEIWLEVKRLLNSGEAPAKNDVPFQSYPYAKGD